MDTTESYMGVLGEIDVWDGLDDVDMEQSTSYNALDNEHRAHECSEAFSTNEVWSGCECFLYELFLNLA